MPTKSSKRKRDPAFLAGAVVIVLVLLGGVAFAAYHFYTKQVESSGITITNDTPAAKPISAVPVTSASIPAQADLEDGYYIGQTFNNCAPSALSMDLSYYGVDVSQAVLAADLRPDNNSTGKDDDKSTSPEEVAAEAQKYGLTAYYRPDGNIQLLEDFVANGIPVLVRTRYLTTEDFLHYRVIKGYDQTTGDIIDEDGIQGAEVHYSYADFMSLWKMSNYEYIVLVPPGKQALVQSLLGADYDENTAWQGAVSTAQQQITDNPTDTEAEFNLSVSYYHLGQYQNAVNEFAQVQPQLSQHILWYQLEPIEAYLALGNAQEVLTLSNSIIDDNNPAYPEVYVLMGQAEEKLGDDIDAKADFQKALYYNEHLTSAQQALSAL